MSALPSPPINPPITLSYQTGGGHARTARILARASTVVGVLIIAHPLLWSYLSTALVTYLSQPRKHVEVLATVPFVFMPLLLVGLLAPTGLALSLCAWKMGARLYSISFGMFASLTGGLIGILYLLM